MRAGLCHPLSAPAINTIVIHQGRNADGPTADRFLPGKRTMTRSTGSRFTREFLSGPLLVIVCIAQLAHLAAILFLRDALLVSQYAQLFFPTLAFAILMYQRHFLPDSVAKRCWGAVAGACGIWALAQAIYIYSLFHPVPTIAGFSPDNALWMLFGLPLLLAINTTYDEWDRVRWFDRAQEVTFFLVLYVLVFRHGDRLNQNTAFIIQNLALSLCCVLRLPACTVARERRFFIRLTAFLFAYSVLETVGDILYLNHHKPGSAVDLVWTLPFSIFIFLTLRDTRREFDEGRQAGRIIKAFQRAKGISVAMLAFLSIGASAYLATFHPVPGGVALCFCFVLFALRTNSRERAWQEAHGKLEETVLQDTLTGLGNRIQLRSTLNERIASLSAARVELMMFLDLDRFKTINDSMGHSTGDRLLIEVADRLRSSSPKGSVVCRLGGDEFVVVSSAADSAQAELVAQDVLDALRQPYVMGQHVLRCSASVGVVCITPGAAIEDLLRTADHAMYRAKQLGKNRVQMFDAETMAQMSGRWALEADLRACIEQETIDVAYQPLLCIADNTVSGFEALARWTHPEIGAISPGEFIPLAEETGLILPLGAQILEKACRQVAQWNRAWDTSFTVSVNVSPRQFADHGFLKMVLSTLDRSGMEPSQLRLEITESLLLVPEGTLKQLLHDIRSHGIHISLDDFGTGYSSLSFLLSLPVDEVKIDRSFVSDMHHNAERREVVKTVVQLGRSLRKRVVAEGVESVEEMEALAALGCDCAQGWLIGKPLPAAELEQSPLIVMARGQQPNAAHSSASQRAGAQARFDWSTVPMLEGDFEVASLIQ